MKVARAVKTYFFPKPTVAKFIIRSDISELATRKLQQHIERAQEHSEKRPKEKISAVALIIDSPGGSPVQSSLIAQKALQFAKKHNVKLYTFSEDLAASGGYWILCVGKLQSSFD
jgi:ClpP class serine protease